MQHRARSGLSSFAIACALCACGASAGQQPLSPLSAEALRGIDGSRFTWVESECNDSPLDLARLGFEREVELSVRDGALQLTFDTEVIADGCSATSVVQVVPASDPALWRFEPQAIVALPEGTQCGARERKAQNGSLRLDGDELEIVYHASEWCRGFDARFVFRRSERRRLAPRELIGRYVAHWNRRDARALSELFVDSGTLIEPFTRTDDGNYARHEGREALRDWYGSAFASVPWSAMRLLSVQPGATEGHFTAEWEYMDPLLSAPLRGRNLFVLAGGEIYEAELQLVTDPEPAGGVDVAALPATAAGAPRAEPKAAR